MKIFTEMLDEIKVRLNKLLQSDSNSITSASVANSKDDAKNRLKLVLMHDRSKLAPDTLTKMKDELVDVISKYVEIDKEALDLNLEDETSTIALVANIPILRAKIEEDKLQKAEN